MPLQAGVLPLSLSVGLGLLRKSAELGPAEVTACSQGEHTAGDSLWNNGEDYSEIQK